MSQTVYYILSAVLTVGVLIGIAMMSKVERAKTGNMLSAVCMALAIIVTLLKYETLTLVELWAAMLVGLGIGAWGTVKVKMIQMPQAVALLNGLGGAASLIVGVMELLHPSVVSPFSSATAALAVVIGSLTLTGSLIAAAKLQGMMKQKPVVWPAHAALTMGSIIVSLIAVVVLTLDVAVGPMTLLAVVAGSFFGVAFAIRVGGADMPITISLLNSFSGVAAGIAGLAVADPLLVAIGGIVGASGLLLTQIMCKAMNRHLMDILLSKAPAKKEAPRASIPVTVGSAPKTASPAQAVKAAEAPKAPEAAPTPKAPEAPKADPVALLKAAKNVIIVPGYGMALAQAQELVKALCDKLEALGAKVKFAIHPVAGRMPGHMNVLLAEVDVPYEELYEMDDINPEFDGCDVCVIIGANDVVNPAANTAEGTPIYGMPVLEVSKAKHLIICNFDTKPGYAGVDNPLYTRETGVSMLMGDAKATLTNLLKEF